MVWMDSCWAYGTISIAVKNVNFKRGGGEKKTIHWEHLLLELYSYEWKLAKAFRICRCREGLYWSSVEAYPFCIAKVPGSIFLSERVSGSWAPKVLSWPETWRATVYQNRLYWARWNHVLINLMKVFLIPCKAASMVHMCRWSQPAWCSSILKKAQLTLKFKKAASVNEIRMFTLTCLLIPAIGIQFNDIFETNFEEGQDAVFTIESPQNSCCWNIGGAGGALLWGNSLLSWITLI